jgi:uncharacterized membrane protein
VSYYPILLLHILAGAAGLSSGFVALFLRKGSPRHALAGKIFVASMLAMAVGAVYLGVVKNQPSNVTGGILTFYLVGTGWLTARRSDGRARRTDWLALMIPLAVCIFLFTTGINALRRGETSENGVPVGMNFFMGSICLLAAAGDVRMLVRGGIFGAKRLARHLWRMCFGLFIASGSFFLGPSNRPLRLLSSIGVGKHLPAALFNTSLYLALTMLPLVMLIFWLVRVRFTNGSRKKPLPPAPGTYSLPV